RGLAPIAWIVVSGSAADRSAPRSQLGMDEGARRRVDLVVAEHERRTPVHHEVQLLVTVLLVVLLDDSVTRLVGGVRVRPEGLDPEAAAHRPPYEALLVDGEAVELVEMCDFVGLVAHILLLSASRTTGSICSTP